MSGEPDPISVKPQSEGIVTEPEEVNPPQIEETSVKKTLDGDLSVKPPEMQ